MLHRYSYIHLRLFFIIVFGVWMEGRRLEYESYRIGVHCQDPTDKVYLT